TGFTIEDLGSRNGTLIGGLPLAGALDLADAGRIALGDACEIDHRTVDGILTMTIERGLDRGTTVLHGAPGSPVALDGPGVAAEVGFDGGRPRLRPREAMGFNGHRLVGEVELVRGDQLTLGDVELEVA